jgi:Ca2+/Na+ antiporter
MSSAAIPEKDSSTLTFNWKAENATSEYYIYMHFAEVVDLKANQSRSFNITVNGKFFYGPFVPDYLSTVTVYSPSALMIAKNYEVSIFKTENSTLPPILNAVEIYSVRDFLYSETDQQDRMFSSYLSFFLFVSSFVLIWMHMKILVDAITKIKSSYGVKRNWQGDPCVPQAYSWEGLNCSYDDYNPPRIISL